MCGGVGDTGAFEFVRTFDTDVAGDYASTAFASAHIASISARGSNPTPDTVLSSSRNVLCPTSTTVARVVSDGSLVSNWHAGGSVSFTFVSPVVRFGYLVVGPSFFAAQLYLNGTRVGIVDAVSSGDTPFTVYRG